MYLKASFRNNPEKQAISSYYRMVESYRNEQGRVCHKTLLNIGFWEEASRDQKTKVSLLLTSKYRGEMPLFTETDERVLSWVSQFWDEMIAKKTIDRPTMELRHKLVSIDSIKHKEAREIGTEWLCAQTWNKLQMSELLKSEGWGEPAIQLAMTQIISRAVYPASEHATSKWIKDNSAVCDITGYPVEKMTKDKLYQSALSLYNQKGSIEKHLSKMTNELFDLDDRIILYDLTNTYFEGGKAKSDLAKYGRSKEKRNDAKLVVMAMVVNTQGFIKYSAIHQGNYSDSSDIGDLITKLAINTSMLAKPIVVLDAGIATEKNLVVLSQKGFRYVVVSRSKLKEYESVNESKETYLLTKSKKVIRLTSVKTATHTDHFLKVDSPAKAAKEQGIKNRYEQGYEQELAKIQASLTKSGGIKKEAKVHQRIGRAKEKYPSIHHLYNIELTIEKPSQIVTAMNWLKIAQKQEAANIKLGTYFLRTNIADLDEGFEWMIYNTIREIESTFRTLKTDLDLRPIFHQNDTSTMAHLHLGVLAYWIVNTIRYQLKNSGIKDDWKEIRRKASTQKSVITTAQNVYDKIITIKRITEPSVELKKIHQALDLPQKAYKTIKYVVHKPPLLKIKAAINQIISSA